jgi:hypothetical protein
MYMETVCFVGEARGQAEPMPVPGVLEQRAQERE